MVFGLLTLVLAGLGVVLTLFGLIAFATGGKQGDETMILVGGVLSLGAACGTGYLFFKLAQKKANRK